MTADRPTQLGPFGFEFHQVAMFTQDIDGAVETYSSLGFTEWTWDHATLKGIRYINGIWQSVTTLATMAFNYEIMPMELEFLEYDGQSAHRHQERSQFSAVPFISHMSVHVESVQETIVRLAQEALSPYHIFVTQDHDNPYIVGKKRFVECIFDTRADLGYDIKCIERIPWDSPLNAWEYFVPDGDIER